MDDIFRALSDPTRRRILDLLRERDGRTVTEIEQALAAMTGMTRFGIMKHLGVLEGARLIVPRRAGRFKYLHLNIVPLQQVIDRWIDPMLRPMARQLEDLRHILETETDMTAAAAAAADATFVLQTYIRTTPERLWQALTDPEDTVRYYFASRVASDWTPGADIAYRGRDGGLMLAGRVISADPPRRLVTTFQPHWDGAPGNVTRVTFDLEQVGSAVKLTLTHEDLTAADQGVRQGWSQIIAGLKTLLETGQPLVLG